MKTLKNIAVSSDSGTSRVRGLRYFKETVDSEPRLQYAIIERCEEFTNNGILVAGDRLIWVDIETVTK